MIFDGIKKLNKGEKHLKITCDNAKRQNKNNVTIWFYLYLVICGYYESIELNFMIPGHTKFKCDGNFGMIKKLYRRTRVDCLDHVVEVSPYRKFMYGNYVYFVLFYSYQMILLKSME